MPSGLRYGSGLNNTAFTTLKMPVFTPMPNARVAIARNVNPGFSEAFESRSARLAGAWT